YLHDLESDCSHCARSEACAAPPGLGARTIADRAKPTELQNRTVTTPTLTDCDAPQARESAIGDAYPIPEFAGFCGQHPSDKRDRRATRSGASLRMIVSGGRRLRVRRSLRAGRRSRPSLTAPHVLHVNLFPSDSLLILTVSPCGYHANTRWRFPCAADHGACVIGMCLISRGPPGLAHFPPADRPPATRSCPRLMWIVFRRPRYSFVPPPKSRKIVHIAIRLLRFQ